MNKIYCCLLLVVLKLNPVFSQNLEVGSWNILNMKYNSSEKLSFFAEAQLRSLRFYQDFHYYEYKGGIDYKLHKSIKVTIGAGSYQTFKQGGNFLLPKNNNEFRLWPQLTLIQDINKFKLEQRYRTEMRWTSNGYRNRFRYRLGISYSFGKEKQDYKPFQMSFSNEIFFTNIEPYFERNRTQLSFNYKTSNQITLQIGYLKQFDYKINDETGHDFLILGLYYELSKSAKQNKNFNGELIEN